MSDKTTAQRKPKGLDTSWKPFRVRKDKKYSEERCELQELTPPVDFEPETKPPPTFVYSDETSDIATPVSPHTLKLLEAIREDELELVEEELAKLDRQAIDQPDSHGFALIHVAARYNLSGIVNTLLEHGADVNIGTSEYRWTPLHLAARCVVDMFFTCAHFFYFKLTIKIKIKRRNSCFSFGFHRDRPRLKLLTISSLDGFTLISQIMFFCYFFPKYIMHALLRVLSL